MIYADFRINVRRSVSKYVEKTFYCVVWVAPAVAQRAGAAVEALKAGPAADFVVKDAKEFISH